MHIGKGRIDEIYIQAGRAARITCDPKLVPAPGQYLLAHAPSSPDDPLPRPIFLAASHSTGFYAAQPLPVAWTPGTELTLRGPLGCGFNLPASARKVALAALGTTCSRLLALLELALAQNAEIALLTDASPQDLPAAIEILPLSALAETAAWADYLALDAPRATIQVVLETIPASLYSGYTMEILVGTPIPCGGMGDCGVCDIYTKKGVLLACKDGPVIDLKSFLK
jgi:dihydroorotate dehydrogenase electron transfer subunit